VQISTAKHGYLQKLIRQINCVCFGGVCRAPAREVLKGPCMCVYIYRYVYMLAPPLWTYLLEYVSDEKIKQD